MRPEIFFKIGYGCVCKIPWGGGGGGGGRTFFLARSLIENARGIIEERPSEVRYDFKGDSNSWIGRLQGGQVRQAHHWESISYREWMMLVLLMD